MNWINAKASESDGKEVMLASLTPRFDEASHGVYYDLLTRAIDAEDVRNVALTGAYGTGKSSILDQLCRQRRDDVIEISLSTIAPPQRDEGSDKTEEEDKTQTNLIQKEIVKQLLYRLPAHKTPRSRFRRTSPPQTSRDWLISAVVGVLTTTIGFLLGLLEPLVNSAVPEPWGRRILAYALVAGGVSCVAWFVRRLLAGSPAMSASLGAGLTSVTLSSTASTYFDEYLDEIVYFFQSSKTKVVVIEDIDRFEDIKVFDTLRALNVLLNSSSALGRIVFVYAIRDSIFEQIEKTTNGSGSLSRRAEEVANRAKFFDVIVPVVPFVNADNARDLMSRSMMSAKFSIDQSLIRISARHTADMRLIHNIRNEFEVYRNRLIIPDDHIYGITDDLIFAMIVFKNAHLADFEKIRHKDSTLDHLYTSWRELVRSNSRIAAQRLAELRTLLEADDTANERAYLWSQRFLQHVEALRNSLQNGNGGTTTLDFVGEIDEPMLTQRSTWRTIATGTPLRLQARTPRGYVLAFTFSAEQLSHLLGITIDQADWGEPARTDIERQIEECEERIRFLRHHTWAELRLRPEFTLQGPNGSMTFDQLIRAKTASPLAAELVQRGFITSHFALYTSTYYGTHLGPDALEYVRRCIEPGEPDTLFQLDPESIQQILIEQGADKDDNAEIFDDASILNVSIIDFLLKNRPHAASRIAQRLTVWDEGEADFISNYCARGQEPERLLAAMAPWWPPALQYTALDAPLPPEKRIPAIDAVIGALPHAEGYDVNDKVRDLLEAHYSELPSVTSPASAEQATTTFGVFRTGGATIRDVRQLNQHARKLVIAHRLYPVTVNNLQELAQVTSIALDALLEANDDVYAHAIEQLGAYLAAFDAAEDTKHTIEDNRHFVKIVRDADRNGMPDDIGRLVSHASEECHVVALSDLPPASWPTVLAESRTEASFTNVHAYIAQYGSVDDVLAAFLTQHDAIEWDEDTVSTESRQEVAQAILNAADVLPNSEIRIRFAVQLKPGELAAHTIKPQTGGFAGRLVEADLVPDDAETFGSDLIVDWSSREAAIVASGNFESIVSPETLPVSQLPQMLQSESISTPIKKIVVGDLPDYLSEGTRQEAEEITRALNLRGWKIGGSRIRALMDCKVSAAQIVQLVVRERDMPLDELRDLLRELEDPYPRLADPGRRPAYIPDDQVHEELLQRLAGVTVSTYRKAGNQLKVNLLRTER